MQFPISQNNVLISIEKCQSIAFFAHILYNEGMKKICILGSTGSIGTQTLDVAAHLKDEIEVFGLANHRGGPLLKEQIRQFCPQIVVVSDEKAALELKKAFPSLEVWTGNEGICALAAHEQVDTVVAAIGGMAALDPVWAAAKANKTIALANKEVLVSAGDLILKAGATIIPVDSEHSALFQCLQTGRPDEVGRLILTASGGPFKEHSLQALKSITAADALAHPTWNMGAKITIDSSTLMNKGLEVIEAHVLFGIPFDQIEVVIHPQSIVHSLVEWCDGSMIAQLSEPSMHLPIQYALTYPKRLRGMKPCFDFTKYSKLEFGAPDLERFVCLQLAFEAGRIGRSAPCFMNGANEVLVERFLQGAISWHSIGEKLLKLMEHHQVVNTPDLETVKGVDATARALAKEI